MRADDIMTMDVVAVGPDAPVPEIARILNSHRIGGVPVVDETRQPVGMVSGNDLVRRTGPAAENGTWWLLLFGEREDVARDYIRAHKLRAADVMSRGVVSVADDTGIADMARLMEEKRVNRLPVMRGARMVGIVTRGDVMRAVASGGIATRDAGRPDLRQRILAELAAHRLAPPSRVNVIVAADEVHLWGTVADPKELQRLAGEVAMADGASRVVNHLAGPRS
jgi:CBS domain-containing protein